MSEKVLGFKPKNKTVIKDDEALKLIRDTQKRPFSPDDGTTWLPEKGLKDVLDNVNKKGKVWKKEKKNK